MKNLILFIIFLSSLYAVTPFTAAFYQNGFFYTAKKDELSKRDLSKEILKVKLKDTFIRDIKAKDENIFLSADKNGILSFVKMDKNLNVVFSKEITKEGISFAFSFDLDDDGYIYLTGGTTADIGNINAGATDIFIMKLDKEANRIWTKQFGGENDEWGKKLILKEKYIYMALEIGESLHGGDFKGIRDIAFMKIDRSGETVFIKEFGTKKEDIAKDIKTDKNGNIYILGETWGKFANRENHGFSDLFLAKFDKNGNLLWIKEYGSPTPDTALNMQITDNFIYIGVKSTLFFDYVLSNTKAFLIKNTLDGKKIWTQPFNVDNLIKISLDKDRLYLIGDKIEEQKMEFLDRRALITRLYSVLYQREPKEHEIAFWEKKMKDIKSIRASAKYFFNSEEFSQRYGELSKIDFIKYSYRSLLNREPDHKGLRYWQKYQKDEIARGILYSKEFLDMQKGSVL